MKKDDWFLLILGGAVFVVFSFQFHKQWRIDHPKPSVASSNTPAPAGCLVGLRGA